MISKPIITIALAMLSTSVLAQDLLIYKFARTRTWKQWEAQAGGLPANTGLKGRNILSGISKDNSYWIIDQATNEMTEIRYYTAYVDDVKQKLYDISPGTYTELGLDASAYSLDRSGNFDQFMELMTVPTSKAGVNNQSMRSGVDGFAAEGWSFVWDLLGPTTATIPLSRTVSISNKAKKLSGLFRSYSGEQLFDGSGENLTFFRTRVDAGPQSATLDTALTLKVRTLAAQPSLTPNTMDNGIQCVADTLERLGYDLYLPPVIE